MIKPIDSVQPQYSSQWKGAVPEHWHVCRLKDWVSINKDVLPENTDPDLEFRYMEISALISGILVEAPKKIRFSAAPSRARRRVKAGDTIISTVRTYLKAIWYADDPGTDLVCSTGFAVLTPKQGTNPRFVSYLVQSGPFTDRVTAESVGTAYPAISENKLASLEVLIPPSDQQAAIVRYLDDADQRIREYVSAKERLIALLEEERQAVIHQAVTRGLDPNVRLKPSGVEWLDDVPEHWEVGRLKAVSEIRYGLGQPPKESETGLPLIRATNVSRGHIVEKDLLRVDPADVPAGRDAFLREKEIIVVRSGAYTADSAIVPREYTGAVTGYDMVVTATDAIPEFIAAALLSKYLRDDQLIVASNRAAQPHLNAEELGTAVVLLPPIPEQLSIVEHLNNANRDIDTAITCARRQIELMEEYRTRLIADVVTGEIDVR